MADSHDKHPLNAPGSFYNDNTCIDCDICREIAPRIFRRDEDSGQTHVWKQPVSMEDLLLAHEAIESCPTDTIGCEG